MLHNTHTVSIFFSSVFRVFNWNENRDFTLLPFQQRGAADQRRHRRSRRHPMGAVCLPGLGLAGLLPDCLERSPRIRKGKKRRTNFKSKTRKDCLSLKQRQNRLFLSRASPVAELAKNEYFGWSRLSHLREITAFANSGRGVTSNFNTVCRRSSLDTTLLVLKK